MREIQGKREGEKEAERKGERGKGSRGEGKGKEGWSLTDKQEDEREERLPENPKSTGPPPGPASSVHCRKRPPQLRLLEKRQAAAKLMRFYRTKETIRTFSTRDKANTFSLKKKKIKIIQLE